jgi:hypothetical protein
MPRHEPSGRQSAGEPPPLKLKVQLDPAGKWRAVEPERKLVETIEAAERPPTPDDPRASPFRQIPPMGGG